MGWGFVCQLAKHYDLWVIVEEEKFRTDIEQFLAEHLDFGQRVQFTSFANNVIAGYANYGYSLVIGIIVVIMKRFCGLSRRNNLMRLRLTISCAIGFLEG